MESYILTQQLGKASYQGTTRPLEGLDNFGEQVFGGGFNKGISNLTLVSGSNGSARLAFSSLSPGSQEEHPSFIKLYNDSNYSAYSKGDTVSELVQRSNGKPAFVYSNYSKPQMDALSREDQIVLICSNPFSGGRVSATRYQRYCEKKFSQGIFEIERRIRMDSFPQEMISSLYVILR